MSEWTMKFRGKRIDNGEWVYGLPAKLVKATDGKNTKHFYVGETYDSLHEVHPDTVGQYTGLHDNNGTEIYEGDIIEGTSYLYGCDLANGKQFDYKGYVYWGEQCDCGLCWFVGDMDLLKDEPKEGYVGGSWELKQTVHRNDIDYCTGEVIGTIHDEEKS